MSPFVGFFVSSFFLWSLFRRNDRSRDRDPGVAFIPATPDPIPSIPAPFASEGEQPARHDLTLADFIHSLTLCLLLLMEPFGSWIPLFSEVLWSAVFPFAAPLCYSVVLLFSLRLELVARHRHRRILFTGRAPKKRGVRLRRIRGELKCPRRSRGRLRYPCPRRLPERTGRRGAKQKRLNEIFWVELLSAYADVQARNRAWKKTRCLGIPLYRWFMLFRRLFRRAHLVRDASYVPPPEPDPDPGGPDWATGPTCDASSNPFSRVYSPDEVEAMRSVAADWFGRRDPDGDDGVSVSSFSTQTRCLLLVSSRVTPTMLLSAHAWIWWEASFGTQVPLLESRHSKVISFRVP